MRRVVLRIGMMASLVFISGCATFLGEDPATAEARQQTEFAEQAKYDQLQMEAERLRSEIDVQKMELENL